MSDEQELLRQVRGLDEAALAEVFDLYYQPLYRYIYHHVGHVATAEDLTAEVFRRLLEQLYRRRGPKQHLRAWLYRVAHNLVIDDARRNTRRKHEGLREHSATTEHDIVKQADEAILREQARAALAHLTPKQRAVIILRFLEGLDNPEVARILQITVGSVKALQHRGLAAMRRYLIRIGAVTEEWT